MKTKRIVSIILSVLMACSVFAGLSVAAEDSAAHTYTVVGDAKFLGAKWTPDTPADDMALQADGTYKKTYTGVAKTDCATIKVAQDHAWDVSFGAVLGVVNPENIEFSVPEDNSTVDVILTLSGTREKEVTDADGKPTGEVKTIEDGTVKVLVNGADAPAKVVPLETTHYVAGEPGLCNGVEWDQTSETNKMTKNEDGSYEITFKNVQPKEDGTAYGFKVTTNGVWEPAYGYDGLIAQGGANAEVTVTKADSEVRIVLTADLKVKVYVNGEDVTPEPIPTEPKPTETIVDNKTSAVTSNGGIYTGPSTGEKSRRYFFAMRKDWYTFANATACAYWWDGTDKCENWQHSYQLRSTPLTLEDGSNVYYIDLGETVANVIFNNGIDGGAKAAEGEKPSPNWGKNFQTKDINLEGYMANDSDTYPEGLKTFANMIYVVDPSQVSVNELSGATTYGGEWYYLHADGKYDTTAGSTYEVKDVTAVITTKNASVYPGKTAKINVKYSNTTAQTTKVWSSSNTKVATVNQNGVVKGVKAGKAKISLTVQNPGDAQALVVSCNVTVKQYVTSIKLNATKKTIYNGKSFTLKAKVNPKNAANKAVTYKSSNKKIATVTSKGVVKGIKPGKATITVTAKDGSKKSAKCTVTVKAQKATKLKISAKKTTTLKKKGASVKIKATLYPSNTYNKLIKVSSSKKGIVKLSASKIKSGKTVTVKATKKGSTVVKFTAADGSRKSAQTKVTVKK